MGVTEASPLLPLVADGNRHSKTAFSRELIKDELCQLLTLMYPVTITFFLEYAPGITTLLLVGHYHDPVDTSLDKITLDAAAVAIMYLNLTGLTIGLGLASAMDTLCSQAFGAQKLHEIGVFFQTGLIILGGILLPIAALNWNCTSILLWLSQPEEVALFAGEFVRIMYVGLPFLFLYELLKKVLQAQNIVLPMLYCAIFANVVNIVAGYVLTYHSSLGYLGAAVGRTIANISLPLSLIVYLFMNPSLVSECWPGILLLPPPALLVRIPGWQLNQALAQTGKFLALGISGLLMVLFEWWSFELLVLIAGLQENAAVAIGTNAILINVTSCTYMLYFGISTAANVRVGNALGGHALDRARVAALSGLGVAACIAFIVASSLLLLRNHLAYFFTDDEDIAILASKVILTIAMYQVADAWNTTVQGILRGCGLQTTGAILNCIAYGILGLPLGIFLDIYSQWNLVGLWTGMAVGICFAGFTGALVLYVSDWHDLMAKAEDRVKIN